jgi:hypothetical protein
VPKYWHASQVNSALAARIEADAHLAAEIATTVLDSETPEDVRSRAREWAEDAPGPSSYL